MKTSDIKKSVKIVEDFPKKGVSFLDITSVLDRPEIFTEIINRMADSVKTKKANKIIGLDARGFIFASALAYKLKIPFVIARKKGKLPGETISCSYGLEYGRNELELQVDSIKKGDRIVIVDDILATGGTAKATLDLSERLGGEVKGLLFFAEILSLNGRSVLADKSIDSIVEF